MVNVAPIHPGTHPRLQSDRCQGAVFVCNKGAFYHKLKTWDLVFVKDVRL